MLHSGRVFWLLPPALLSAGLAQTLAQSQTFSESVLNNFTCTATCAGSAQPSGNLLQASDGNIYGVTAGGGQNGGSVFKITPAGGFTTLYTFCSQGGTQCTDGFDPVGGLVEGSDGNFYGTTAGGGSGNASYCPAAGTTGCGTVFQITPAGALTTLYNFCSVGGANCADGYNPVAALVEGPGGNFYGSTVNGACAGGPGGCGSLFEITPAGELTTLYSFCTQLGCPDGYNPYAALTFGTDGNFYGSTLNGGVTTTSSGGGVLFKLTPAGEFLQLYAFCQQVASGVCLDGNSPSAILQGTDGNFYGTAFEGGSANSGTAFEWALSGTFTTIYNFCSASACSDGSNPNDLILASDGNFYSTTLNGGANSGGTAFRLTPSGTLTTLYAFCSQSACGDGSNPNDLVQGSDGNLYSTTQSGGSGTSCAIFPSNSGCGTVVKLTASPAEPIAISGSVANGATYLSGGLVPGSWAQIKGTDLAGVTRIWDAADFVGLGNNLPVNLNGVQVTVNNIPAAVYYISPGQISFQVPAGISGTASVQVSNNGLASNTLTGSVVMSSPGIFPVILNGVDYPAGVFTNGQFVGDPTVSPAFRQATPGDVIQLYATGLVATPSGVLPAAETLNGVTVTVGSTVIPADYAGLVAVGEFQINFTIPQSFATQAAGLYPISIQVNGASSPLTINSSPPGQMLIPIQP